MMDSVPVVFITGQVRTDLLGTDGFQEADTIGITMPAVKHSIMITDPLEIPRAIHEAFYLARSGRPGPVVVDVPVDLSRADIPYAPVDDVHLPRIPSRLAIWNSVVPASTLRNNSSWKRASCANPLRAREGSCYCAASREHAAVRGQ